MKLLDTTILVDFLRRQDPARQAVQAMEEAGERVGTTEVNAFELLLGAYASGRANPGRLAAVEKLLNRLEVIPLNRAGAVRAAQVLSALRAGGRDGGVLDALIAGITLASGYDTIVSRDEGFRRIPGLKVETY
jgi:predicted nucleic acid-binding protein